MIAYAVFPSEDKGTANSNILQARNQLVVLRNIKSV